MTTSIEKDKLKELLNSAVQNCRKDLIILEQYTESEKIEILQGRWDKLNLFQKIWKGPTFNTYKKNTFFPKYKVNAHLIGNPYSIWLDPEYETHQLIYNIENELVELLHLEKAIKLTESSLYNLTAEEIVLIQKYQSNEPGKV